MSDNPNFYYGSDVKDIPPRDVSDQLADYRQRIAELEKTARINHDEMAQARERIAELTQELDALAAAIDVRPCVLAFAHEMEQRLRANDRKGEWAHMEYPQLERMLRAEVVELHEELVKIEPNTPQHQYSPERVRAEAADAANLAMMIADTYGQMRSDGWSLAHQILAARAAEQRRAGMLAAASLVDTPMHGDAAKEIRDHVRMIERGEAEV